MRTQVTVVGAGPVGLMLAGELRLAGADVVVCELRAEASGESRGVGFTRRAAEVFDQRGLLTRLGEIEIGRQTHFGGVGIDTALLDDNHFGVRGVAQHRIETMLEEWVTDLGAIVLRGHELVDLNDKGDVVVATMSGPDGRHEITAEYLVGCDGARSTVRRLVGIDFPGHPATRGAYVADIAGQHLRARAIGERVPGGMVMAVNLEDGVDRIVIHPDSLPPRELADLTFTEIADSWQSLTGESLHGADVRWISCFTDTSRQAEEYRRGRVFLAGDAAHIHIPAGAQGLSVGVQDAVNLGWKLAAVLNGGVDESLLDSYHTERHPVGAGLMRNTRAQALLYLSGDEMEPLRRVLGELFAYPEVARRMAGKVSGLDVRYDMGTEDHPLVGFRLPTDWRLTLADGREVAIAELLHLARGVLITTGGADGIGYAAAAWSDSVDVVRGTWVPAGDERRRSGLTAVLLRPDGYVAWAAPGCGDVRAALARWFGAEVAVADR
ncbi:MAG TPA: FAD-dependent monooxygenase [Pseudonocardiaceae bacterium]|nr:FAD-dependent monooxygenase [Pseudonocardiaceae bacterium]